MKRTNLFKKYAILFLFVFMISTPLCYTNSITTVHASEVQPLSDDIRWVYHEENGVWYRRLYNFTTRSWIGEWTKVP